MRFKRAGPTDGNARSELGVLGLVSPSEDQAAPASSLGSATGWGVLSIAAIGVGLCLAIVLGIAAHQAGPFLACRRLADWDWHLTASPAEQRETAHTALAYVFGDPHDCFGVLQRHGDRSSIPHLQAALARQPKEEGGGIECTWMHGRLALDRVLKLPAAGP